MRICKPSHKIPSFCCLRGEGNAWLDMVNVTQAPSLICVLSQTYWEKNHLRQQPLKSILFSQASRAQRDHKTVFVSFPWGRLVINMTKIFKFYSSSHNWTFLKRKDNVPCVQDFLAALSSLVCQSLYHTICLQIKKYLNYPCFSGVLCVILY